MTVVDGSHETALARSLRASRFEIIPMRGVEQQLEHLPRDATVTVTSSPTRGIEPTIELGHAVAAAGHRVVPHIAARSVRDHAHLSSILDELDAMGATGVFVPAGDAPEPAGDFHDAAALLQAMEDLGRRPDEVGITGYPESHATISDEATIDAMWEKSPLATHIVSQICYDPSVTAGWVRAVRARGVHLPIVVGLPGVVDRTRLLRISMRIGLGDSLRFVSHQAGVAGRLLAGYTPEPIVEGLAGVVADPDAEVVGWHLFTFNEVERTVAWWRQMLARAAPGGQP